MSVEGPIFETRAANPYFEILGKTQREHRLLSVLWELTYRCNERCSHCYLDVSAPHAPASYELSTAECLRLVDDLAALGALNLTLSGGEILVRRDLFEIAEHARARGFLLRLFTNGILVTPAVADRIAALHPYAVEISVYGACPETHDQITGRARSFDLTTRALRLLRERGVRTVMKSSLMRENIGEFSALQALAKELGAQFHHDIMITPKDTGDRAPLKHRLAYEDLVRFFRGTLDPAPWAARAALPDQRMCNLAANALSIDPFGNVFPCVQVRIPAGNLRARSIQTIWKESPVWEELNALTLGRLPTCRTCGLNRLCSRCHGLAFVEQGDIYAPAPGNCIAALARRQVLVERGARAADYPIPPHLQTPLLDPVYE